MEEPSKNSFANIDTKALKILNKTTKYNYETQSFYTPTQEEFDYAFKNGLMFKPHQLSHDQGVSWLLEVVKQVDKQHIIDLFLSSLSTARLDWRSGLSAYAIARNFPDHAFIPDPEETLISLCPVCGYHKYEQSVDENFNKCNAGRFFGGGGASAMYFGPISLAFYLEQSNRLDITKPTLSDICIFNEILQTIFSVPHHYSSNDLENLFSKNRLFKSNKYRRRVLIETLGYCNILETDIYKGFTDKYVTIKKQASNDHLSDWEYPVRMWRGSNGINCEALSFWFGDYVQPFLSKIEK
jgi:hypothetical protein